jgi:hypothetical protein
MRGTLGFGNYPPMNKDFVGTSVDKCGLDVLLMFAGSGKRQKAVLALLFKGLWLG